MKFQKRFFYIFAVAVAAVTFSACSSNPRGPLATVVPWEEDFAIAKQRAQSEGKPILINFTGSGWCPPCIVFEKEIFSKPAFISYAKENLVLMKVNFPKNADPNDASLSTKFQLKQRYEAGLYPTIFLLDSSAEKISDDLGVFEGNEEKFIGLLKGIILESSK